MNDRFFVDTNLLVYAYDRAAGSKHNLAVQLFQDIFSTGTGVISTQVLQELAVCLRRKVTRRLSSPEIQRVISELQREWEIVVNVPESILGALRLEDHLQISFWDALIVQAALTSSSTILYSEDLNHGQTYGAVQVINPFKI